jgi:hypothetical protein
MEFMNFVLVLATAVTVAGTISSLYAMGLRLWGTGALDDRGNVNITARVGSVLCFSACVSIVLFALWLMIPLFH